MTQNLALCSPMVRMLDALQKDGMQYLLVDPQFKNDKIIMKTALASVKILQPDREDLVEQLLNQMPLANRNELREFVNRVRLVERDTKGWISCGLVQLVAHPTLNQDPEVRIVVEETCRKAQAQLERIMRRNGASSYCRGAAY